jgi:hypothetical protein
MFVRNWAEVLEAFLVATLAVCLDRDRPTAVVSNESQLKSEHLLI